MEKTGQSRDSTDAMRLDVTWLKVYDVKRRDVPVGFRKIMGDVLPEGSWSRWLYAISGMWWARFGCFGKSWIISTTRGDDYRYTRSMRGNNSVSKITPGTQNGLNTSCTFSLCYFLDMDPPENLYPCPNSHNSLSWTEKSRDFEVCFRSALDNPQLLTTFSNSIYLLLIIPLAVYNVPAVGWGGARSLWWSRITIIDTHRGCSRRWRWGLVFTRAGTGATFITTVDLTSRGGGEVQMSIKPEKILNQWTFTLVPLTTGITRLD